VTDPARVFVTGGTGHLGRNLLARLRASGYAVRALTRHPDRHPWLTNLGVEIVAGDVENGPLIREAASGCRYVIHAAGRFSFWGRAEAFARTNVRGTQHVLDAAQQAGVARVVHVSTIGVIGRPLPGRPIDEDHPPRPTDAYQRSKLAGERLAIRAWRDQGLPVIVLRPGAFYGPYGRYAFNRLFIEDPLRGLRIQVNGGRHITFPVFITDVADSAIAALKCGQPGAVYHVCGDPLSHRDANRIVSEEAGISPFRLNVPGWSMIALAGAWTALSLLTRVEPYYPINLRGYVFNDWHVSSEKARRELAFTPTDFREGVRRTLAWYREVGILRRPGAR
jgi:nucleoside-diphosphate-sugar epimerase